MPAHMERDPETLWDPVQYHRFSDHRLRPALELIERVPLPSPYLIYDIGCGSGGLTRFISERWAAATVYGLDHSREMLQRAAEAPSRVHWVEADIRTWSPESPPDLIVSNSVLHWIEAHNELFPRLLSFLKPGGVLAVQMPLSRDLPSHRLMRQTLSDGGPGGSPIGSEEIRQSMNRRWVESAEYYYDLLAGRAQGLDIWQTEYLQALEGCDPVVEWVKGAGLRPILTGLGERDRELFLLEYTKRIRAAYPVRPDGRTLYPFRRLFIVASV